MGSESGMGMSLSAGGDFGGEVGGDPLVEVAGVGVGVGEEQSAGPGELGQLVVVALLEARRGVAGEVEDGGIEPLVPGVLDADDLPVESAFELL